MAINLIPIISRFAPLKSSLFHATINDIIALKCIRLPQIVSNFRAADIQSCNEEDKGIKIKSDRNTICWQNKNNHQRGSEG